MGKQGRRQRVAPAQPAPISPAPPVVADPLDSPRVPRALRGVDDATRGMVAALLQVSEELERRRAEQADLVAVLRESGVSWDSLGWCIGTTGEAVRQRFGGANV